MPSPTLRTPPKSRTIIEKISFKTHNIHELAQSQGTAPQKLPAPATPWEQPEDLSPLDQAATVSSSREERLVLERGAGSQEPGGKVLTP